MSSIRLNPAFSTPSLGTPGGMEAFRKPGAMPFNPLGTSSIADAAGLNESNAADAAAELNESSGPTQQTTAGSELSDMMNYMRMCAEARIKR